MEAVEQPTSEASREVIPLLAPGPMDDIPTITRDDLPKLGCTWKNTQLRQLIKTGEFPAPYRPSKRKRLWSPRQIREFLESRKARRIA